MFERKDAAKLLLLCQTYDNRNVGEMAISSWHDAAVRNKWTFDEAVEAVREHYGRSTEWLMPGHVTQGIKVLRDARREPFRAPPALEGPASSPEVRERAKALVRDIRARKRDLSA